MDKYPIETSDDDARESPHRKISHASSLLPGIPATGQDARWQAVIRIGEYTESHPEDVWQFVARWGTHEQDDVREAIATCLLEHLLEHHFDLIFPRVLEFTRENEMFADTFCRCWKFGESEDPANARRFDALQLQCQSKAGE